MDAANRLSPIIESEIENRIPKEQINTDELEERSNHFKEAIIDEALNIVEDANNEQSSTDKEVEVIESLCKEKGRENLIIDDILLEASNSPKALTEDIDEISVLSNEDTEEQMIEPSDAQSFIEMEDANIELEELPIEESNIDDPLEDKEKSRFNLRKRITPHSSGVDYGSDDYDVSIGYYKTSKKLKLSPTKKNYRRQRPYTNETVKIAVKMVQSNQMNLQEASREYKIPRTSLYNFVHFSKEKSLDMKTISPIGLKKQEESEIVSLVMKLSRCGKRYSHNELRFLVQYYLISNDRPVFKSGTLPTMGWVSGLVERQRELSKAKSKKNTKVALEDVEEWQAQIEDYLINDWDLNIKEMFSHDNGNRIFCFNAFRMLINSPGDNIDGKPSPVKKEPVDHDKMDVEVGIVLGISADGRYLDPMIIIPDERKDRCSRNENKELRIMFSSTGRVDEDAAIRIVKDFDEYILTRNISKPVVFFVNDKHDLAHFSVIEYCWENQIILICLPPKTTKTMTPFEIGIWPKLRSVYSTLWKNAQKNSDQKIEVDQFSDLFIEAWDSVKTPKTAVRGFIRSGLIPFNVPAILKEAVDPNDDRTKQQILAVIDKQKIIQREIDQRKIVIKREIIHPQSPSFEEMEKDDEEDFPHSEVEEQFPSSTHHMEERSRGKLEGIEMCLKVIESFIPPDVMPVWNLRGTDYRGRCELAFKLWRSVSLLLKAGCAMASIQQMSSDFFNPFGSEFSSTAEFFQKSPKRTSSNRLEPSPSRIISRKSISPPPLVKPNSTEPISKKRKLKINKSIYSRSGSNNGISGDNNCTDEQRKFKPLVGTIPLGNAFVRLYPSSSSRVYEGEEQL